jgi:hypothetical protein
MFTGSISIAGTPLGEIRLERRKDANKPGKRVNSENAELGEGMRRVPSLEECVTIDASEGED